ncbi:MAG: phytoene/squalene synthase family protein [Burkholderiaceae bacterium]
MNDRVDPALIAHAAQAIEAGSSSFAAAARLFDVTTRESTLLLYAWCRHCDDVIDAQQSGHARASDASVDASMDTSGTPLARLTALESATALACVGTPTAQDPVFTGLAEVVRRHGLEHTLLQEHLRGFRMDIEGAHYQTLADTLLYCYRVAGVVGLMMARVMGVRDPALLDRACDLGMAFQLTNIARDIVEDAGIGRIYLPAEWLSEAGVAPDRIDEPDHREALANVAARLVEAAEPYYTSALAGIGALPLRSAWSIATARGVYRAIGRHVKARGGHAWDARVATSGLEKIWLTARGGAVALATRAGSSPQRADSLWQRPKG